MPQDHYNFSDKIDNLFGSLKIDVVYCYDKNTEYEELGFYTSKKRALEVLDEIQNILKPKN